MQLTLSSVRDLGDDVLEAVAVDENGNDYRAAGWVSATVNHYDPHAYAPDGHLAADAKPRPMSAAEVGEYALGLVLDQHPELAPAAAPAPVELAFAAPAPVELAEPPQPDVSELA